MKAIVLRHHDEDNPGLIGLELERRGFTLTIHRMPEDGPPPNPRDYDLCIVLGAKWSLVDRVGIETWIDQELDWLRTADAAGVPVLGICFGSQALAAAHGGRVTRAPKMELGWTDIVSSEAGISDGPWFQFHSDQCIIPDGATELARNQVCVQAFSLRKNLAVLFHPELERLQLEQWLDEESVAIVRDFGLDTEQLLSETDDRLDAAIENVRVFVDFALGVAGLTPTAT